MAKFSPGVHYSNDSTTTIQGIIAPQGQKVAFPLIAAQTGVPVILAPNGTVSAGGVITLGTALATIYAGAWVRLPAGAIVGGAAGLYWTTFSSTTVGAVKTNFVDPVSMMFTPFIPSGSLTSAVGSASAYTQTTGTDVMLCNMQFLGNALGPNGKLRVQRADSTLNNANVKTSKFWLGGTAFGGSIALASTIGGSILREIQNRGIANSQVSNTASSLTSYGPGSASYTTIDTTQTLTLALSTNIAVATDYVVLENYTFEYIPS